MKTTQNWDSVNPSEPWRHPRDALNKLPENYYDFTRFKQKNTKNIFLEIYLDIFFKQNM